MKGSERAFPVSGLLEAMRAISYETDRGSQAIGADDFADANDLLTQLEMRGWKLVRTDPFADVGLTEPNSCPICEGMCCGHGSAAPDVLTDRQGVLDAFAERLTKIEDRLDVLFDSDGRPAADTWLSALGERVDHIENRP